MRLLLVVSILLFGFYIVMMVGLFSTYDYDQTTLDLYLVSVGRGFNRVFYVNSSGVSELQFSVPPGMEASSLQAFSMTTEMLVQNYPDGSVTRVRFSMNNTPRGISHIATLRAEQQPPTGESVLDSFSQYQSQLTRIGTVFVGFGLLIFGHRVIRTKSPKNSV